MKKKRRHIPESAQRRRMRFRYGLEPEQYAQMFEDQQNKCAVCNKENGDTKGTKLYVDHDHRTNQVRQLLCASCNTIAGTFEADVERTFSVMKYLRKHKSGALAVLELKLREMENDETV